MLDIITWGELGTVSDRFPGHPDSVDTILKVDESTVITGSSDGLIRIVQIQPNKLLGIIGQHEFPVERMALDYQHQVCRSECRCHDNSILPLLDMRVLCSSGTLTCCIMMMENQTLSC